MQICEFKFRVGQIINIGHWELSSLDKFMAFIGDIHGTVKYIMENNLIVIENSKSEKDKDDKVMFECEKKRIDRNYNGDIIFDIENNQIRGGCGKILSNDLNSYEMFLFEEDKQEQARLIEEEKQNKKNKN